MTLKEFNSLDAERKFAELTKCCGSSVWVKTMWNNFPFDSLQSLLEKADEIWRHCSEEAWREAFSHHPKIGDLKSLQGKFASTSHWASREQSGVNHAANETLIQLQQGNKVYEEKFGYIFIVCATGKSAEEMLALLKRRIANSAGTEINIAMEEQMKITRLRLQKLLS